MVTVIFGVFLGLSATVLECTAADELPVTYQLDSLSPMIQYSPARWDGDFMPGADDTVIWGPNHAANAWNSTFFNRTYRMYEINNASWPHYTWATYQDGMPAPEASVSFTGREVALVGPPPESKPKNIGTGIVQVEIDGNVMGTCAEDMTDVQVRCKYSVDFGTHKLRLTVLSGAFAIDHFEISTGIEEQPLKPYNFARFDDPPSGDLDYNYQFVDEGDWGIWLTALHETVNALIAKDNLPFDTIYVDSWNLQNVQNISIFDTVLDPNNKYQLSVRNMGPNGSLVEFSNMMVYKAINPSAVSNGSVVSNGSAASNGSAVSKSSAVSNSSAVPNGSGVSNSSAVSTGSGVSTGSRSLAGGAIAGIVVGSVAGVAAVAILGWLLYRRHKGQRYNEVDLASDSGEVVDHTIEPYHDDNTGHSNAAFRQSAHAQSATFDSYAGPSVVPVSALATKETSLVPPPGVTVRHVHHTDGGAVAAPQSAEVVEETPPTYNPDWTAGSSSGGAMSRSGGEASTASASHTGPSRYSGSEAHSRFSGPSGDWSQFEHSEPVTPGD